MRVLIVFNVVNGAKRLNDLNVLNDLNPLWLPYAASSRGEEKVSIFARSDSLAPNGPGSHA